MPSMTVHLRMAQRVLDHWNASPDAAPFPLDPASVNAFRHGAFAPDFGYFPGGCRPLSDLAHTLRTADLARALVRSARRPVERAFAWGWVSHVMLDSLIHPLVGCAAGELRYGSPAYFVDGDSDQITHVRVEAGLDALYAERHPELRRMHVERVFDEDSIGFLVSAYRTTYGAAPDRGDVFSSHRDAARRARQGTTLAAVAARGMPTRPGAAPEPQGPLRALRAFVSRRSVGLAYVLPAPPPLWFINAVRDVEETFVEMFSEELDSGGEGLANVNLDTGRPDLSETRHGGLQRSLIFLRKLGAPTPFVPGAAPGAA